MADPLVQDFLAETWSNLSQLDRALVALEKDPRQPALIAGVFRTLHIIKGACSLLQLNGLGQVAHAAETVLDKMRDGSMDVDSDGISLLLEGVDRIKELLTGFEATGEELPLDSSSLIAKFEALAARSRLSALQVAGTKSPLVVPQLDRSRARDSSIRVQVDLLDRLMNLVGELVLTRNQFLHLMEGRDESKFTGPISQLDRLTTQLQQDVMKTRLQPVGQVWSTLPRFVRDLARITGKPMELEMHGTETELDRTVLAAIQEALTHLTRNAADHGIERLEDRRSAGKPDIGRLILSAVPEAGQIVITLEDDGAGISRRKVIQTAVDQNLLTEAEAERMTERELLELLYRPGFSTAEAVTSVSGRGVGLDVVRMAMERVGGTIEMTTSPGQGTKVRLKIPLTMAVMSVCIVETGGKRFAIPYAAVGEVVQLSAENSPEAVPSEKPGAFRLRDRVFPLVQLHQALQLEDSETDADDAMVVVVRVADEQLGVLVAAASEPQELIIKPMSDPLKQRPLFQGTTMLGDGSIIPILDVAGLAAEFGNLPEPNPEAVSSPQEETPAAEIETISIGDLATTELTPPIATQLSAPTARKILVVDDSLFFRQLVRTALESDGYHTTVVESAERAMALIENGSPFDLILCDIEMPGMNGCQFAEWFRQRPTGANLPLVAITSLDADVHGPRIMAAGYDRLLIKFHPQQLRQTLTSLLSARDLAACDRCA